MPRTSEITVTQRASTKLMKISQNFHENFTKISFENSLVPDEMYAFPYRCRSGFWTAARRAAAAAVSGEVAAGCAPFALCIACAKAWFLRPTSLH